MAAILKIEELQYLCKNLTNFDEILHGDASWPSTPDHNGIPCTHTQPFDGSLDFVQDNPGKPAPQETFHALTHKLICAVLDVRLGF